MVRQAPHAGARSGCPVPACRRAPRSGGPPAASSAEHLQRRPHRGRIGVVAFVDQRDRARWTGQTVPRHRVRSGLMPASARAAVARRRRRLTAPSTASAFCTTWRPGAPMVGHFLAAYFAVINEGRAASRFQRKTALACSPKPATLDACRVRLRQQRQVRSSRLISAMPPSSTPGIFPPWPGRYLPGREVAEMAFRDRRDDGRMRATISLSGSISPAWFMPTSNTPNWCTGMPRQGQRHAPVIVERLVRRVHRMQTRQRAVLPWWSSCRPSR